MRKSSDLSVINGLFDNGYQHDPKSRIPTPEKSDVLCYWICSDEELTLETSVANLPLPNIRVYSPLTHHHSFFKNQPP